jgi:hypothetical protein
MYASPTLSILMLDGHSTEFPPRYVEYRSEDPSAEILVTKPLRKPGREL